MASNVTVIGKTTRIRGRVTGAGDLEVQGFVEGEIAVAALPDVHAARRDGGRDARSFWANAGRCGPGARPGGKGAHPVASRAALLHVDRPVPHRRLQAAGRRVAQRRAGAPGRHRQRHRVERDPARRHLDHHRGRHPRAPPRPRPAALPSHGPSAPTYRPASATPRSRRSSARSTRRRRPGCCAHAGYSLPRCRRGC